MRHVSCILLLEWSTTSQPLWVYRISVPYAQKDPRFLFEKRRGQPWELWSLVSTIDGSTLPQHSVFEIKVLFSALSGCKDFTTVRPGTFPCASMYYNGFFLWGKCAHIGCTVPKTVRPSSEMCASGAGRTLNFKHWGLYERTAMRNMK